jgi:iron complex transport system ATP-binding protein
MTGEILLEARNLSVGYTQGATNHVLFENLDLELRAGELVCFMGANGIGKSSLIRTLAGLQLPLSARRIRKTDPKKVSVVLTDRIHAVNMTVAELVALGRYPYLDWDIKLSDNDLTNIEQAIEATRIKHIANKKLYELSDGQLQMAMIARALTQDTPVIMLDEPTAHLDLNNRVEIMNLLRTLSRTSNKAILVATHELDLALQTADLIWLATPDRKLLTGIPEDLVLNGAFDATFQFKGFDLKTGKVFHEAWRNRSVKLVGEGYAYLWTKNALERNGFSVSETSKDTIELKSGAWQIATLKFSSLKEVLDYLSR